MERLERFYRLHQLLAPGRPVPAATLCAELEVSRATLMRDLRYLRLFFEAPIVFRRTSPAGYHYDPDAPAFELPGFWLRPDELWALLAAHEVLDRVQPGLLDAAVAPVRERLFRLAQRFGHDPDRVVGRVLGLGLGGRRADPAVFRQVTAGLLAGRALELDYHARSTDDRQWRRVEPQALVYHRDTWYLAADDAGAADLRIFACDRICGVRDAGAARRRRDAGDLTGRLRAGFGIFPAARTAHAQRAELWFSPERARWVRDEHWHPEQDGRNEADGAYVLSVPYDDPTELIMEVLRHGAHCRVLGPPELRARVAAELREAAAAYGP